MLQHVIALGQKSERVPLWTGPEIFSGVVGSWPVSTRPKPTILKWTWTGTKANVRRVHAAIPCQFERDMISMSASVTVWRRARCSAVTPCLERDALRDSVHSGKRFCQHRKGCDSYLPRRARHSRDKEITAKMSTMPVHACCTKLHKSIQRWPKRLL